MDMNNSYVEKSRNEKSQLLDVNHRIRFAAQFHSNSPVLADSNQRFTWEELDKTLNQVANALIKSGIQPNQRIAILGRNSVDYALLFLGGLRAGICNVPLSTLASSEALAGMVNDSEAKLLFVSRDYWDLIEPVTDKLRTLIPGGLKVLESEITMICRAFPVLLKVPQVHPLRSLSHSTGALI